MTEIPPESTPEQAPGAEGQTPPERRCSHCGAGLANGQDWCLECGAATAGALRAGASTRAGVILVALTALLVVGAAGAAFAALSTPSKKVVLQAAVTTTSTAAATATATTVTTTATTPSVPTVSTSPGTTPKVPKVTPATTPTTTAPVVTPPVTTPTPTTTTVAPVTTTTTSTTTTTTGPTALLLDPGATSDYNPNGYADANFGDPTLAIDGDRTTAWSVQVPTVPSPGGDAGLLIDLEAPQKLSRLRLTTATLDATWVVLGANGSNPPTTIDGPGWTKLSGIRAVNRSQLFTLTTNSRRYRWLVLWVLGVKGGATATLPAPGAATVTTTTTSGSTSQVNAGAATTSTSSDAGVVLSVTSTSTSSTTTTNDSPLQTVDANEVSVYP